MDHNLNSRIEKNALSSKIVLYEQRFWEGFWTKFQMSAHCASHRSCWPAGLITLCHWRAGAFFLSRKLVEHSSIVSNEYQSVFHHKINSSLSKISISFLLTVWDKYLDFWSHFSPIEMADLLLIFYTNFKFLFFYFETVELFKGSDSNQFCIPNLEFRFLGDYANLFF